jgi:surface-anchored protein
MRPFIERKRAFCMLRRPILPFLVTLLACAAVPVSAQTTLTNEHVDLSILYNRATNQWDMESRDGDNGFDYRPYAVNGIPMPSSAVLEVGTAAISTRPLSSTFDFVGVGAGQSYYRLPQSQNPALLYLGVGGYGVSAADVDRYNPSVESKGRINSTGAWARLQLVSVTGAGGGAAPGTFSVWQSGDDGPNVFMSSYDDGVSNPNIAGFDATDGITSDDMLWSIAGGHSHYNWGFSAPGEYYVTLRPAAHQPDGNNATAGPDIQSADTFTFLFNVLPATNAAIPEPSPLALMGGVAFLSVPVAAYRRYRHKPFPKERE